MHKVMDFDSFRVPIGNSRMFESGVFDRLSKQSVPRRKEFGELPEYLRQSFDQRPTTQGKPMSRQEKVTALLEGRMVSSQGPRTQSELSHYTRGTTSQMHRQRAVKLSSLVGRRKQQRPRMRDYLADFDKSMRSSVEAPKLIIEKRSSMPTASIMRTSFGIFDDVSSRYQESVTRNMPRLAQHLNKAPKDKVKALQ